MKFLILPDSFKNCLSSTKVGECIKNGISSVFSESSVKVIPIADGGEGTVNSIISVLGGEIIKTKVHDPLGRIVDSFFGILPDQTTAIIEMAAASGIELLKSDERNPLESSTYGTGELIKQAIEKDCTKIIIGIGGSATNDGGMGMAAALGARFMDVENKLITPKGKNLNLISSINLSGLDQRIKGVEIIVASDVTNPLCGDSGATNVFSKQKGATSDMKIHLEKGLHHFGTKMNEFYDGNILEFEGGGAAGGLGAGLVVFTGARLKSGFKLLSDLLNLENEIVNSDIIISAEGRIDFQTLFGKAPAVIAEISKKYKKPFFVFAGAATDDTSKIDDQLIKAIIPITRQPVSLQESIQNAPRWLEQAAKNFANTLETGINFT